MDAVTPPPRRRGLELLLAHCSSRSAGEERLPARERLEAALGAELARRLVDALVARGGSGRFVRV